MCVFRSAQVHVLTGVVPAERTSHSMIRQTAVGRGRTAGRRVDREIGLGITRGWLPERS